MTTSVLLKYILIETIRTICSKLQSCPYACPCAGRGKWGLKMAFYCLDKWVHFNGKRQAVIGWKKNKLYCLLLTFCYLLFLGCGYTIQTRADLPFDTILIGQIENRTVEPGLQDKFSKAVARAFAEYGFRVSSSARFMLEGEIIRFELEPLVERDLVAIQYEIVIKADFRLIDTKEKRTIPLVGIDSPFATTFSSTGKLQDVIAQKEMASSRALKNLSQEIVRRITYNIQI